ncbi:MAG: DUF1489 family protein [Rhodospirillales bacterium]|nr:DUF1489 family protein [Rhodospirillales bacterium]
MTVHLIKLCVGVEDVDHLARLQSARVKRAREGGERPVLRHCTRHAPKRLEELLDGGSIFWVIKGVIRVRQRLIGIEEGVVYDGRAGCGLVLGRKLVRTEPRPFRAFQGWRYLKAEDAPADARRGPEGEGRLPDGMAAELRELGLL